MKIINQLLSDKMLVILLLKKGLKKSRRLYINMMKKSLIGKIYAMSLKQREMILSRKLKST